MAIAEESQANSEENLPEEQPKVDPFSVDGLGASQRKALDMYARFFEAGNLDKLRQVKDLLGQIRGALAKAFLAEHNGNIDGVANDTRFAEDSVRATEILDPKKTEKRRGFGVNKHDLGKLRYRHSGGADRISK